MRHEAASSLHFLSVKISFVDTNSRWTSEILNLNVLILVISAKVLHEVLCFFESDVLPFVFRLFPSAEVKLCKKTILHNAGSNGDAVSRKPPMGRRDTSTPPPAPPGGVLVRRSQVCLSTFYKECAESADSEPDCSCQPAERDGRSDTQHRAELCNLCTQLRFCQMTDCNDRTSKHSQIYRLSN